MNPIRIEMGWKLISRDAVNTLSSSDGDHDEFEIWKKSIHQAGFRGRPFYVSSHSTITPACLLLVEVQFGAVRLLELATRMQTIENVRKVADIKNESML
jgi:hypothetical protein